jgi:hypothetical protein
MNPSRIGLMQVEGQRLVNLCQPKTVLVSATFNAGDLPQGIIKLETRIDNVVAYRLKFIGTTLAAGVDWNPSTDGSLFVLRSSTLASNRNHNHFVSNLSSSVQSIDQSNIIGYLESRTITTPGFAPAQAFLLCKGHLQSLSRPLAIEQFDWSINLLNNALPPPTTTYAMNFAIEFYSPCQCQVRYNTYGSL